MLRGLPCRTGGGSRWVPRSDQLSAALGSKVSPGVSTYLTAEVTAFSPLDWNSPKTRDTRQETPHSQFGGAVHPNQVGWGKLQ